MNKMSLILLLLFSCLSLKMTAQDKEWEKDPTYTDGVKHKEYIVNVTPLIAQFVPFNASNLSKLNLFDYQFRKMKNGKGIRWGLGVNVDPSFNSTDLQFFFLRFGWIRKNQISSHLHLSRSYDINFMAEDFESANNAPRKLDFSGFGLSYSIGLEYSFSKHISISTEGSLFLGLLNIDDIDGEGPKIRFIPPVGLFFHVKL